MRSFVNTYLPLFVWTVILVSSGTHALDPLLCPSADVLGPCFCFGESRSVQCWGNQVTQSDVDNLMTLVREVNGLSASDWLSLSTASVAETRLTQLDLTPFLRTELDVLRIEDNVILTDFTGPQFFDQISVFSLLLSRNALTDSGVESLFTLSSSSTVKLITADNNQFRGSPDRADFLPGLSHLTDLRTLQIQFNYITTLHPRQFFHNKRLGSLILSNNLISEIKQAALVLDEPLTEDLTRTLQIQLDLNKISDGNLSPQSGLQLLKRPVTLHLAANNLVHLSVEKFEPYLYADFENVMGVQGNSFICNGEMKWLRDAKVLLEARVHGANCTNDPEGLDIFNTSLDLSS